MAIKDGDHLEVVPASAPRSQPTERSWDSRERLEFIRDAIASMLREPSEYATRQLERALRSLRIELTNVAADPIAASPEGWQRQEDVLRRLLMWDHFDSAADGPFWRREIRKALGEDDHPPAPRLDRGE